VTVTVAVAARVGELIGVAVEEIGVFVVVGIRVGSGVCPFPQPDVTSIMIPMSICVVCCFVFMVSYVAIDVCDGYQMSEGKFNLPLEIDV
jgi:hypothetical protein